MALELLSATTHNNQRLSYQRSSLYEELFARLSIMFGVVAVQLSLAKVNIGRNHMLVLYIRHCRDTGSLVSV